MTSEWQLPLRQVPRPCKEDTSTVWNRLRLCYEQKLFGQVTCIAYNHQGTKVGCTSSHQFALLRVPQSDGVVVNEQSDRGLFSIRFRDDDKLFVQCVEKRVCVKSPDTAFERQFLGHTRDVRCAAFLGSHNFVSGSDDTSVKMWDLLRDNELMSALSHTDYVRCLEPFTSGCFFSGSYDHTVQLWDPRTSFKSSLQHSRDCITQAGMSTPLNQSSYGRVKMHALDQNVRCLATKRFEGPIAAVAVHPLSEQFSVGMTSGDMKIFKIGPEKDNKEEPDRAETTPTTAAERSNEALESQMRIVQQQLRTYTYKKALMSALYSKKADVIMSTVEELLRRGTLHIALANQNDRSIAQVLRFAVGHIDVPQFSNTLFAVLEDIFEIYGCSAGTSTFLHRELLIARKRLGLALETINKMEKLQGIMEFIVEGSE
eukprot:gene6484-4669_t